MMNAIIVTGGKQYKVAEGDVIYIRKQPNVDHDGQVAVVVLDDTATVKHVYRQKDGLLLVSDNPAYPPMYVPDADKNAVQIIGKVIELRARF